MELSSPRLKAFAVTAGFSFWFFVITNSIGLFSLELMLSFIIILGLFTQIFSKKLYEHGESEGLNFIDANVVPFRKQKINIGWSKLIIKDNEIFKEFSNKKHWVAA